MSGDLPVTFTANPRAARYRADVESSRRRRVWTAGGTWALGHLSSSSSSSRSAPAANALHERQRLRATAACRPWPPEPDSRPTAVLLASRAVARGLVKSRLAADALIGRGRVSCRTAAGMQARPFMLGAHSIPPRWTAKSRSVAQGEPCFLSLCPFRFDASLAPTACEPALLRLTAVVCLLHDYPRPLAQHAHAPTRPHARTHPLPIVPQSSSPELRSPHAAIASLSLALRAPGRPVASRSLCPPTALHPPTAPPQWPC